MRTYRLELRLIQLGVIIAAIILVSGFVSPTLWGGVKEPQGQTDQTPDPSAQTDSLDAANKKIVAFGDSFTLGYPGTEDKSWPKQLENKLKTTVVNKGQSSQTAQSLIDRFDADVVSEAPGIVIIFVGNGDAINNVPLEKFQANVKTLVEKAKANHIIPVLALPLPWAGKADQINPMREWETEYTKTEKIRLLDFASVLMDKDGKYLEGMGSDKYPNDKGYAKMGEYAANMLK